VKKIERRNKMRKPNNWYQLDYDQQQEWRQAERAIEDAEYELRQAKEGAEHEQSLIRKHMREANNEHQREYDDICDQLQGVIKQRNIMKSALELAREALEEWHDEKTLPAVIEALEYNPQEDY
jgi:hypothetical protein